MCHLTVIILLAALVGTSREEDLFNSEFSWKLFKHTFDERQNVVMSPFLIRMGMALMANSVTNQFVMRQLMEKLSFGGSLTKASEQYRRKLQVLTASNAVRIGTKVYVIGTEELNPLFLAGSYYFQAQIERQSQMDGARLIWAANRWANASTGGMVSKILQPSDINDNVRLLLLNAVAFRGEWETRFQLKHTKKELFYATGKGQPFMIDMMNAPGSMFRFGYYEPLGALSIELPFRKDTDLSLVVIIPQDKNGNLTGLVQKLNHDRFRSMYDGMTLSRVDVKLPRISLRRAIDVKGIFRKLRLNAPFEWSVFQVFKKEQLMLDKARHSVSLEVDEKGARVAAVSSMSFMARSATPAFVADHPFLYAIVKRSQQFPLFIGNYAFPANGAKPAAGN